MKFYDLSRKERRKLKNQFDKTILGMNIKDTTCIYIVIAMLFLVSPLILCMFYGHNAIGLTSMLMFFGFFLVFSGLVYVMAILRYVLLKEFYDDKKKEKDTEKEEDKK